MASSSEAADSGLKAEEPQAEEPQKEDAPVAAPRKSDGGGALDPSETKRQLSSTLIGSLGTGCQVAMIVLCLMTALAYSLNEISTGSRDDPDAASQGWFTLCLFVNQLGSLWFAEFMAQWSLWYGRKNVCLTSMAICILIPITSVVAQKVRWSPLFVLSLTFMGPSYPVAPFLMAYVTDVSTPDKVMRNMGLSQSIPSVFLFLGVGLNKILTEKDDLTFVYYVAMGFAVVGFLCFLCLPDVSPPKHKRFKPTWKILFLTAYRGPCRAMGTIGKQTAFTQLMLWNGVTSQACISSISAWLLNYMLKELEFDAAQANNALMSWFVLFAIIVAVSGALLKPSIIPIVIGSMSFVVSVVIMGSVGKDKVGFLIGMFTCVLGGLAPSPGMVLYMGQQPPARRHELLGTLKLLAGFCRAFATVFSGTFTARWLYKKEQYAEEGKEWDGWAPCWTSLPWCILTTIFPAASFYYRKQDKKLYGNPGSAVPKDLQMPKEIADFAQSQAPPGIPWDEEQFEGGETTV